MRRHYSLIRYGLPAVVVIALALTTIALVVSSPANADEVPGPLLLAGSDCDESGPFIKYRVSNESDGAETLLLAIDDEVAIGSERVDAAQTKHGRIEWLGDAASSVVIEARWATNDKAPSSTINVAPNPCAATSAADFTGPAFMAGTDCRDENAIVRWWMSNTADEHRHTYVSIGNEDGTIGETIWPRDGSTELLFAGAQTGSVAQVPAEFAPGTRIRVSGWGESTFGIAETWTQMLVPSCGPLEVAGDSTIDAAGGTSSGESSTTARSLTAVSSTTPAVATTFPSGDGTTTTLPTGSTTSPPGETTTTVAGPTTTVPAGSSTTSTPPPTTTSGLPGSTTRPPATTTTRPPTTTTTTRPPATTTTTTTAPPSSGVVAPVFLAGADCSANGPYIRYRVTNSNATTQTLQVTFDGSTKVSSVSVAAGQTKWGTFGAGSGNEPKRVVASWVGQSGTAAPTLLMRASICQSGLPQPARGPGFVAGQDCSGGRPIVRWWMKNTAPTTQTMNVTLTKAENGGERITWPVGGGTIDLDANVQVAGSFSLPSGYNSSGQEVRIRGWWRGIDPSAHNRVGIVVAGCR